MRIALYNRFSLPVRLIQFIIIFLLSVVIMRAQTSDYESLEQQAQDFNKQGNNNKALEFFNKAGYGYWSLNQYEKAISCFENAANICQQANNNSGLFHAINNLGLLYTQKEDNSKALTYFMKALEINKKLHDKSELSSNLFNIALTLQNLNRYKESIEYFNEVMKIAQEESDLKLLLKCYGHIASSYEKMGVSEKAFDYYEKFEALDHKIKNDEMANVTSTANQKVIVATAEKNATEIKLDQTTTTLHQTADSLTVTQQLAKERQMQNDLISSRLREEESKVRYEKKIRRVQSWTISIISILLISLAFMFRQKLKDNDLLKQKNIEIEKQKEEISIQNTKLERQNSNIRDSITYALTIQNAILPSLESMQKFFDCFVVYLPKDIVSGDFYWFMPLKTDVNNWKTLMAVVDCTGHGVPGAFMSLIGNRLLSEIINKKNIANPAEILNTLNRNLCLALKQDTSDNEDGMDICLCMVEKSGENYIVDYAGAKRPLIYFSVKSGEIKTLIADRQSLGGHRKLNNSFSFSVQHIELQKGDILYLSSDGLIDQNGPDHRRFGSIKLLEILKSNALEPISKQKDNVLKDYYKFLASEEQRDDITLIGARLI
jgi:serine phosphatase RsbU (regulator of sigma subunit)